jgi:hypothetical protein
MLMEIIFKNSTRSSKKTLLQTEQYFSPANINFILFKKLAPIYIETHIGIQNIALQFLR